MKPSQVLFVDDSMERDHEGAMRAGLNSLLIDRRRKDKKNVDSINDLTKILYYF